MKLGSYVVHIYFDTNSFFVIIDETIGENQGDIALATRKNIIKLLLR